MTVRISAALGALAVGAALFVAAAAPAHAVDPSTDIKLDIAKQVGGNYGDVVNRNLGAGDSTNVYVRFKSLVTKNVSVSMQRADAVPGLRFRYFTISGKNITKQIKDDGFYSFTLKPSPPRKFRIKLTAKAGGVDDCVDFTANDNSGFSVAYVALNGGVCPL